LPCTDATCTLAINIEHSVERTSAFVIITVSCLLQLPVTSIRSPCVGRAGFPLQQLGEMIVNCLYHATAPDIGLSQTFGRASLTLIVAFLLNWM
jgi:hypothetical protein